MQRRHFFSILVALFLSISIYLCSNTLLAPEMASAHAYVIGSDPIDGSTVNKVPREVHIYFNATVSSLSRVHIYSIQQQGTLVEVSAPASYLAPTNPRELITPLQKPDRLPQGGYEVYWTAIAQDDGHTTFGTIGFNVGYSSTGLSGTPTLGPTTSNDIATVQALDLNHFTNILSVLWEWFVLAALIFWIGTLLIEQLLLARGERNTQLLSHARKRSLSLQWLCLTTILFGEIVSFILRFTRVTDALQNNLPGQIGTFTAQPSALSTLINMLIHTHYGLFWLIRIVLLFVAMGFLYWTNRSQPVSHTSERAISTGPLTLTNTEDPTNTSEHLSTGHKKLFKTQELHTPESATMARRTQIFWLSLAGLLLGASVLSRQGAEVLQPQLSALFFGWLSLLAQCIWFGGFTYLAYVLLPLFKSKELEYRTETLVTFLRNLTPFVLTGIGIQFTATLFLSNAAISNLQQFIGNAYGSTLLVQLIILLSMLLLSLYIVVVIRPRLSRQVLLLPVVDAEMPARRVRQYDIDDTKRNLKQLVSAFSVLATIFLLCSALLTFFAPPIVFPDITYTNLSGTSTSSVNVQSKQIADLNVTLLLEPGRNGVTNTAILTMNDSQGKLITDAQVQLSVAMQSMNMGTGHATINGGSPTYISTFDNTAFNMAGVWDIDVVIQRPGQATVQSTFHIMLQ